jgi:hypothetical protein
MRVSLTLSNSKKKLCVYEIIELAFEERSSGHLIDIIKPGINAARTRDKAWASSIGVFVMYQNAGARA